jgi:translation initiation factor eIF-2B subunit beta
VKHPVAFELVLIGAVDDMKSRPPLDETEEEDDQSLDLSTKIRLFELSIQNERCKLTSKVLAKKTLNILGQCFNGSSPEEIESQVIRVCSHLRSSITCDVIPGNICTAVLDLLNDELNKSVPLVDVCRAQGLSLLEIFVSPASLPRSTAVPSTISDLRSHMREGMDEIRLGIENAPTMIQKYAKDYIHDGDIVMTIGASSTVRAFLLRAAVRCRFAVLIPEHAPSYDGLQLAKTLRHAENIECAVIPDSAVFAVMPRVTCVFSPVRAIFADGTLVTASFVQSVALAARHHAKPFVVLYTRTKLTNRFRRPRDSFTILGSPHEIATMDDLVAKNATILNPDGEVMSGNSVALFISEDGAHGPDDVFQIVRGIFAEPGSA